MASDMENDCPMKVSTCNECKEDVLRKDMEQHQTAVCPERICECPYQQYGCHEKIRLKELEMHLSKSEMEHLKLKVMCFVITLL